MQDTKTVLMVAEQQQSQLIVGLVLIWIVSDEVQIMEVAVTRDFQGQGVGRKLLQTALDLSIR